MDDTYFVATLDNDRRPIHPGHDLSTDPDKSMRLPKSERDRPCRFCELQGVIQNALGERSSWPINGAIAVPVEMLETWLLMISNPGEYPDESSLPIFARKDAPLAQRYFANKHPPDQLKDLRDAEKARLGLESTGEYFLHCAERLAPADLALRSPSFALFRDQLLAWE